MHTRVTAHAAAHAAMPNAHHSKHFCTSSTRMGTLWRVLLPFPLCTGAAMCTTMTTTHSASLAAARADAVATASVRRTGSARCWPTEKVV